MIKRIVPLLLFFYFINAQIALPTFQAVHKPHTSSSYDFTSHTFTNCGETGKDGPTLSDCTGDVNYSDSWTDNTDYFNVTSGIQEWTRAFKRNLYHSGLGSSGRWWSRCEFDGWCEKVQNPTSL